MSADDLGLFGKPDPVLMVSLTWSVMGFRLTFIIKAFAIALKWSNEGAHWFGRIFGYYQVSTPTERYWKWWWPWQLYDNFLTPHVPVSPVELVLEDDDEEEEVPMEHIDKVVTGGGPLGDGDFYPSREKIMRDNPAK